MKKKVHNMLFLMLDLRFKNLCLMFTFIGFKQSKGIVEKYDGKTMYPMFVTMLWSFAPIVWICSLNIFLRW